MRVVVFLDLDDSVFQTRPKCPPGRPLTTAALARDGEPLSFMTDRQARLLEWLRQATIIPTTARNLDAFRRVTLSFNSLAIIDFGGVILTPDGSLDPVWDARIRPLARSVSGELDQICQRMLAISDSNSLGIRVRVIGDFDMPLYVIAKHPQADLTLLDRLRRIVLADLDHERYVVHVNDNNLSVVPRFLGKEHAVRHVLSHHLAGETVLTVGMADSLSDAAFLELCDYSLLPQGSQLTNTLLRRSMEGGMYPG